MPLTTMAISLRSSRKRNRAEFEVDLGCSFDYPASQLDHDCNRTTTQYSPAPLQIVPTLAVAPDELTTENLIKHTQLVSPEATVIMPPPSAPTTSTMKTRITSAAQLEDELFKFGAWVDASEQIPQALRSHINNVVKAPRQCKSPNAKYLAQFAKGLAGLTEASVVQRVAHLLLFHDKLMTTSDLGEDHIRMDMNVSFERAFVRNGAYQLPAAIPDICVGYVRPKHCQQYTTSFFDAQEDATLAQFRISTTGETVLPFLTAQIKTLVGNYLVAKYQGARDGIAVTQALFALFNAAGMHTTPLDTQHWSLTCNGSDVTLYVHWAASNANGTKHFYMAEVYHASLHVENEVRTFRKHMRNILEHSCTVRVARIKEAVRKILDSEKGLKYAKSAGHATPPQPAPTTPGQGFPGSPPQYSSNTFGSGFSPPSVQGSRTSSFQDRCTTSIQGGYNGAGRGYTLSLPPPQGTPRPGYLAQPQSLQPPGFLQPTSRPSGPPLPQDIFGQGRPSPQQGRPQMPTQGQSQTPPRRPGPASPNETLTNPLKRPRESQQSPNYRSPYG